MSAISGFVNFDCSSETSFRCSNTGIGYGGNLGWVALIEKQLAAFGLTRGTDAGQMNWNQPLASSNVNPAGSSGCYAAFDGSTSVGWTALIVPSAASPAILYYDAGADVTNTAPTQLTVTNYKIWFQNTAPDPAAWTVAGSNDGAAWTTLDTQTGQSAGGAAGYKAYSFANTTGYRYYRLSVTASVGGVNLVIMEWQLFIGAGGTLPVTTPATLRSLYGGFTGYSLWRFADALQSTAPVLLKLGYGSSVNDVRAPTIQATLGTSTNGSLTFTGANYVQTFTCGSIAATGTKYACSGNTNRIGFALGYNTGSSPMLFFVERTHDATGADTADGVSLITFSGNSKQQITVPFSGTLPAVETDIALLTPIANTGLRALNVSIFANYPVMGSASLPVLMNPMMTHWGYFIADITTETAFQSGMYGANHTFFSIGNLVTTFSRGGVQNTSCAMLFE